MGASFQQNIYPRHACITILTTFDLWKGQEQNSQKQLGSNRQQRRDPRRRPAQKDDGEQWDGAQQGRTMEEECNKNNIL